MIDLTATRALGLSVQNKDVPTEYDMSLKKMRSSFQVSFEAFAQVDVCVRTGLLSISDCCPS